MKTIWLLLVLWLAVGAVAIVEAPELPTVFIYLSKGGDLDEDAPPGCP
jgi:hypothetical protein